MSFIRKCRLSLIRKYRPMCGFSLVEVMVSLGILSIVAVTIASAWSGNLLRVRQARTKQTLAIFLERKAIEMEVKFKNTPLDEINDESGDFGEDFSKYRWEFKVKEFSMPDISSLLVSREEGADELLLTMVKQTTEFISKSVKEGKVSVFFKVDKKKEAEYHLTMYFVDYNQPFSIGGG